jgi:hypothetical protein
MSAANRQREKAEKGKDLSATRTTRNGMALYDARACFKGLGNARKVSRKSLCIVVGNCQ